MQTSAPSTPCHTPTRGRPTHAVWRRPSHWTGPLALSLAVFWTGLTAASAQTAPASHAAAAASVPATTDTAMRTGSAGQAALPMPPAQPASAHGTSTPQPSAAQLAALPPETARLVGQGRQIALAADCAACHTAPGGSPFAGNYRIASPLGEIVATNITPSRSHGIGDYSEANFARAVREGVRRDGAHLYPAMPYDAYTQMSDDDLRALYAYVMHGVPAVDQPTAATALPFPFSVRASMAVWNAFFLDKQRFQPDPRQSDIWNRGAYLSTALGHCASCHTPRNALMANIHSRHLAGGPVGPWYAPNITSDPVSGIGAWTEDELVRYLRTGRVEGKAQAAGGMAEAVQNSLQHLPEDDLRAIAVYLKGTPPIRDPLDSQANQVGHAQGQPYSDEATLRGQLPFNSAEPVSSGAALFSAYCASCHQAGGQGTPDQAYPSLFHNTATGRNRPENLIAAILYGVEREAGGQAVLMPNFGAQSYVDPLTDAQVAAIANHVLQHHGRPPRQAVTAHDVAQARAGGPQPLLARVQPLIVPALIALALLVLLGWLARLRRPGNPHQSDR